MLQKAMLCFFGCYSLAFVLCWGQEKETGNDFSTCAADIDVAIRAIADDRLEGWIFTAPVKKHGRLGSAYLVKVIVLEPKHRAAAVFLLAHVKDKAFLWLFASLLVDPDGKVRKYALEGIQYLRESALPVLPFLEEVKGRAEWQGRIVQLCMQGTLSLLRKCATGKTVLDQDKPPVQDQRPAPPPPPPTPKG